MNRRIIFLDIDGVLNHQEGFRNGHCKYVEYKDINYMAFEPNSKKWINKLIEETNAEIVISSTWRKSGAEFMAKVWTNEEMSGIITGCTDWIHADGYGRTPRGFEIDHYLKTLGYYDIFYDKDVQRKYMEESGISNYIIIDDDGDMLYGQRHHFVHVLPSPRNTSGFGEEHYIKAKKILLESSAITNYDKEN